MMEGVGDLMVVSFARGSVRATLALLPPDATREVLQGYLAHKK